MARVQAEDWLKRWSLSRTGICLALALSFPSCAASGDATPSASPSALPDTLPEWSEGYLYIHHISVDGDAAYFVLPDGTTMMFDAGVSDKEAFEKRTAPLKAADRRPNRSRSSAEWYVDYIRNAAPKGKSIGLDYLVISHFHSDHYGYLTDSSPKSTRGDYYLSGVTELADLLPIGTIIDRDYPTYDYPADLRQIGSKDRNLQNYLNFVEARRAHGERTEKLVAGRNDQIVLRDNASAYRNFEVRNVKANGDIWTGSGNETRKLFQAAQILEPNGKYNENPLSLAIKVSYGHFDYFTGGDMTGASGPDFPEWFDTETPIAQAVGEVDVFTMNHHGVRDANNSKFISALTPQIFVIQGRTSDHPGQEVAHRMISRNLYPGDRTIFSTFMHSETETVYGPWFLNDVASKHGHVVIRVAPGGDQFEIFVLDDSVPGLKVKSVFGPYRSR